MLKVLAAMSHVFTLGTCFRFINKQNYMIHVYNFDGSGNYSPKVNYG